MGGGNSRKHEYSTKKRFAIAGRAVTIWRKEHRELNEFRGPFVYLQGGFFIAGLVEIASGAAFQSEFQDKSAEVINVISGGIGNATYVEPVESNRT